MPSKVDICNKGIVQHLGLEPISSIVSPTTKAERVSAAVYGPVIESELKSFRWKFAEKQVLLATVAGGVTITGWDYVYAYPTDCLSPREIYHDKSVHPHGIPFERRVSDDLSSLYIVCNAAPAELVYTANVTDPNLFDEAFITAVGLRIGAELAMPLRKSSKLRDDLEEKYKLAFSHARALAAHQANEAPATYDPITEARA